MSYQTLEAAVQSLVTTNSELVAAVTQTQQQANAAIADAENSLVGSAEGAAAAASSAAVATAQAQEAGTQAIAAGLSATVAATEAAKAKASADTAAAVVTGGTASLAPAAGKIPLGDAAGKISPDWFIVDPLRRSVEVASGGRQTVIYTAKGQPSHMYVLPRFNCEDVAPGGELGTGTHPAFLFNGVAAQEILVGAHLASEVSGEAVSRPRVDPRHTINFDTARARCQANGPGWDMMSNLDWAAIALWCKANGYEPLGNTNWGRHHTKRWETGRRIDTLSPGEAAGTGRTLTGSGPASWAHDCTPAGIQDLVGNVWEWVTGLKMVDGRIWLAPDNGQLDEVQFIDSGFDMPTSRTWATVSATLASTLAKQSLVAPASAALAPAGHLYTNLTGGRLPSRGGHWLNSAAAGLGALNLDNARTYASSGVGFRPRFRAL